MKKEEAIKYLRQIYPNGGHCWLDEQRIEAINMAIDALEKIEKIRAEVERLQNELIQEKEKGFGSDIDDACILELQNVLTYIDSLQEEPKECMYSKDNYTDEARKAVEIAREEELEYVKYQLDLRLPETLDYNGVQVDREGFINDFIKAMRDE